MLLISSSLSNALVSLTTGQIKAIPDLVSEIMVITHQCPPDTSFPARLWLVKNNMEKPPECPSGNNMVFRDGSLGYQFCGRVGACECATKTQSRKISLSKRSKSPEENAAINEKRRTTVLKKYGTDYVSRNEEFKAKAVSTFEKRYGVRSNLADPSVQETIRQTNLLKYGHASPVQNPDIARKIISTKVNKNGDDWSRKERIKARATMREKYGVDHALQLDNFYRKSRSTNRDRWGDENHMKNPIMIEKTRETCLERYGVPSPKQIGYDENDMKLFSDEIYFKDQLKNLGIFGILEKFNISKGTLRNCLIKFGIERDPNFSAPEAMIASMLDELEVEYIIQTRRVIAPLELDFYIPDHNLAIEVCGLYWHSENNGKDQHYHFNKYQQCHELGIRLVTIFEDEFKKSEILKRRIAHALGKTQKLCGARQTSIRSIDVSECRDFLEEYHIQGYCPSSIRLGAYYGDELVGAMTFSKPRVALGSKDKRTDSWELLRMATKGVAGLNTKLFKYFIREYNPAIIVSYCDLRWGDGHTYQKMGFTFAHNSSPNYWYLDIGHNKRQHRYNFTKHSLVKEGYSSEKTEKEIMIERGFDRIWDCGHSKWLWHK